MNPAGQRPAQEELVQLAGADDREDAGPAPVEGDEFRAAPEPPPDPQVFEEAVRAFRARVPMTNAQFRELDAELQARAFTVAEVAQLDVVSDVWTALDAAVAKGTTFADFKAAVAEKLTKAWGGANPPRVENIFRTNVQGAYGAGRIKQLTAPAVLKARPFWKFSAILDGRTSEICRPLNGMVLAADDPRWSSLQPPLHFLCRSNVLPLSAQQAQDAGVTKDVPDVKAQDGFGNAAAFSSWEPDLSKYPPELAAAYRKKLKDAL